MISIELPVDVVTELLRLDLEVQSYKDILITALENEDINISNERFTEYEEHYTVKYSLFQALKMKIENDYVYPITKGKSCSWRIIYYTNQLEIELDE